MKAISSPTFWKQWHAINDSETPGNLSIRGKYASFNFPTGLKVQLLFFHPSFFERPYYGEKENKFNDS